jgi:ribokinase
MKPRILVIGSSNTDMVVSVDNFPAPGETLLGKKFMMNPGGKGANQAVAAARLGGDVTFVAKVGNDVFGEQARQQFRNENICTDFILTDPDNASGIALITVDQHGENTIVVAQGANASLHIDDLRQITPVIAACDIILLQLEISLDAVSFVLKEAKRHPGKKVILNPAPAAILPNIFFDGLFMITPNRAESELLSGVPIVDIESARAAAEILLEKGVQNVIITLGREGALLHSRETSKHVPGIVVKALDTTAAGDIFNAALAVALTEGKPLERSIDFANRAAALSVGRAGAQASAPYRHEL